MKGIWSFFSFLFFLAIMRLTSRIPSWFFTCATLKSIEFGKSVEFCFADTNWKCLSNYFPCQSQRVLLGSWWMAHVPMRIMRVKNLSRTICEGIRHINIYMQRAFYGMVHWKGDATAVKVSWEKDRIIFRAAFLPKPPRCFACLPLLLAFTQLHVPCSCSAFAFTQPAALPRVLCPSKSCIVLHFALLPCRHKVTHAKYFR